MPFLFSYIFLLFSLLLRLSVGRRGDFFVCLSPAVFPLVFKPETGVMFAVTQGVEICVGVSGSKHFLRGRHAHGYLPY